SDGTLVLTVGTIRGGTLLTKNAAKKRKKPYLVVDLQEPAEITAVVDWMKVNEIRVLNVAGPRASQAPETYDLAAQFLLKLLSIREKPKRRVRSKKA
ncbi:MAG TPA: putative molybdenum carrier protein, partial [Planctomycetaceae bacterium]|nr:putative molybdenum carrier protein [Planctomycetaceae bacterium]